MTNLLRAGLAAACVVVCSLPTAAGELKVTMHDGRVTVIADNVPVRQILAEWARVGQTRIVGGDKIPGGPVTLRLENVPERQALDVLLRAASGFMVVERAVPEATLARFDRVLILPTSTAPAGGGPVPSSAGRAGGMNQPSPGMAPMPSPAAVAAAPAEPEPVEPDEPQSADDGRPPETNFDYANPQQFLQKRLEQLQQQQSQGQGQAQTPTTFPGTMSPYGMGGTPTQAAPTTVPGGAAGSSARPGEIIKAPTQQPAMVNPYGIPVQQGAQGATTMQPDRAKYANPYQPPPPPPNQ